MGVVQTTAVQLRHCSISSGDSLLTPGNGGSFLSVGESRAVEHIGCSGCDDAQRIGTAMHRARAGRVPFARPAEMAAQESVQLRKSARDVRLGKSSVEVQPG